MDLLSAGEFGIIAPSKMLCENKNKTRNGKMSVVTIRPYQDEDVQDVINLAKRNLLEVNIKDYQKELMEKFASMYTADYMKLLSENGHSYVVLRDGVVSGCGTVMPFFGKEQEECILLSIYVLPECQGEGIGRYIMAALESDEYYKRSNRIEIPATITACEFYEKFGYSYKAGKKEPDVEGSYHMEKFRHE